ncbi:MAG TPA: HAD-IIIA family hydrolase [Bacteroidia bacterium]|nr:HAD-IIIA family hydrolase [Bacteroidia bacterium]
MNFKEKFSTINTFVFDVDGVLTDGRLLVMPDGEFLRSMNIKDGYAMQLAVKKGYKIAVISGGHSKGVPVRLEKLGITEVNMGVNNKIEVLENFIKKNNLDIGRVLCMGDDVPDIPMMKLCGLSACPADAVHDVMVTAHYISEKNGGDGCVRDVIEQVMKAQGTWA